jgi:phosphocarrier protein HPr
LGSAQFCAAGKERFALVSFAYTLTDPMGLHMRPAGVMAKRLAETPCSVVIRCGTRILNVMALAAKCGETVTIEVSGEDEEATLQELREFFTANF